VKKIRELQAMGRIGGHVPMIAVTANARKDQIMMSMNTEMVSLKYSHVN
jgi:CheY-like chemotaxis protein